MGGPFRAIVGGATQNMSFAAAQAIELNNYSTQYGHLRKSDIFVAPGQIGQVVLVDGITAEIFAFEAPPGASQAAPTAGQICLIKTYEEAQGPGGAPPLGPAPGLLLPIGLDSPQHFHHHTNLHLHGHSANHAHGVGSHSHNHTTQHNHALGGPAAWITTGPGTGGTAGVAFADHYHPYNGGSSGTDVTGNNSPGATDSTNLGNTGNSAPGNTDNAGPGDSDLENIQHAHP